MCGRPALQCAIHDLRIERRCDSDNAISQSKHSRRTVPMTRSQMELAVGELRDAPGTHEQHPQSENKSIDCGPRRGALSGTTAD